MFNVFILTIGVSDVKLSNDDPADKVLSRSLNLLLIRHEVYAELWVVSQ